MDSSELSKSIANTIAGEFHKGVIINISPNGMAQVRLDDSCIITALPNAPVTGACDVVLVDGEWYAIASPSQQLDQRQYARRYTPAARKTLNLDVALLYSVKEIKDYPVHFINPTWSIDTLGGGNYTYFPVSEGDQGVFPNEGLAASTAMQYYQEAVTSISRSNLDGEEAYQNQLQDYNNFASLATSTYPEAVQKISDFITFFINNSSLTPYPGVQLWIPDTPIPNGPYQYLAGPFSDYYLPSVPITAQDTVRRYVRSSFNSDAFRAGVSLEFTPYNFSQYWSIVAFVDFPDYFPPPRQYVPIAMPSPPQKLESSNVALTFYYKKNIKSNPIKILEINESEYFEPILVKDKNKEIILFKLGREKRNNLVTDVGGGGGGTGTSGRGEPESYWTVTDLNLWHSIRIYEIPQSDEFFEFSYPSSVSVETSDYQSWRFENYLLYPSAQGTNTCFLGTEWLTAPNEASRYNAIVKYHSSTNKIGDDQLLEVQLTENNFSDILFKDKQLFPGRILLSKVSQNQNSIECNKKTIQKKSVSLNLPSQLASLVAKPYVV